MEKILKNKLFIRMFVYSLSVILSYCIVESLLIVTIATKNSANDLTASMRKTLPFKVFLHADSEKAYRSSEPILNLSLETAQKIGASPEVTSAEYTSTLRVLSTNILSFSSNFVLPQNKIEIFSDGGVDQFQLKGISNSHALEKFANEECRLLSGKHIFADDDRFIAIIEENLAVKNNLKIGDSITLVYKKLARDFVIEGIYKSDEKRKTGLSSAIPFLLPSNQIYAPIKAVSKFKTEALGSTEQAIDRACYSLTSPESLDAFKIKAIHNGINFNSYSFYTDDSSFDALLKVINPIIDASIFLFLAMLAFWVIIIWKTAKYFLRSLQACFIKFRWRTYLTLLLAQLTVFIVSSTFISALISKKIAEKINIFIHSDTFLFYWQNISKYFGVYTDSFTSSNIAIKQFNIIISAGDLWFIYFFTITIAINIAVIITWKLKRQSALKINDANFKKGYN